MRHNQAANAKFKVELTNRFKALANMDEDLENTWGKMKDAIIKAAENSAGFTQTERKEWISDETWSCIEERRKAKAATLCVKTDLGKQLAQACYKTLDNKVKSLARRDKRQFIDNLAMEAEKATGTGNSKKLYEVTKKLSGTIKSKGGPIKSKDGKLLASNEEQKARWAEHFKEVLNRPYPKETFDFTDEDKTEDLLIPMGPIEMEEIQTAIESMAYNKAAGCDNITAEMMKAMEEEHLDYLLKLFNKIWDTMQVPEDWKKGVIVKIPKKGNLSDCNNWRGITLLSVVSKVFSKVLLNRIRAGVDRRLREEQAGFRPGRSCLDQIFTLRMILEEYVEKQQEIHINFIDFKKAFDSLHRDSLWHILECYGIPACIVVIIEDMYANNQCAVRTDDGLSEWFDIQTGVKQGCILSPLLFGIAIDFVMRKCTNGKTGIPWLNGTHLEDLDFADDIALMSTSTEAMQRKTDQLASMAGRVGLQISFDKTKVMKSPGSNGDRVQLEGKAIEEVDHFTYLGSCIDREGNTRKEVNSRIAKAAAAFRGLNKIWTSKVISMKTKLRLYNSNVLSVLTYGAESWRMTKETERRLDSFENKCLRKIMGIKWTEFKTTEEVRKTSEQEMVSKVIRKRRWKYVGHVCRREDTRIPKQVLNWDVDGKRKRGRPKETLKRTMMREAAQMGMQSMQAVMEAAQDRDSWRAKIEALCDV